jgi:alcohol dehydrogenase class IV
VTPTLDETADRKKTRSDLNILPGTVIYDVNFTLALLVSLTTTSGVNTIIHAVKALYARNGNPIINLLAQEGVRALASTLPRLITDPSSKSARTSTPYGDWLFGTCLGNVGMSLHHKLCHKLGIILPCALVFNALNMPQAMKMLA